MYDHSWWSLIAYDKSKGQPKLDRAVLRRIFAYARPHAVSVVMVLITIIFISLLDLLPPLLYRDLIDNVLPQGNYRRLNLVALGIIGIIQQGGDRFELGDCGSQLRLPLSCLSELVRRLIGAHPHSYEQY